MNNKVEYTLICILLLHICTYLYTMDYPQTHVEQFANDLSVEGILQRFSDANDNIAHRVKQTITLNPKQFNELYRVMHKEHPRRTRDLTPYTNKICSLLTIFSKDQYVINTCLTTIFSYEDSKTGRDLKAHQLLFAAAEHNHYYVCKALLERGINVNIANHYYATPLTFAIRGNHTSIVYVLTCYKANPNLQLDGGETALHIALQSNNRNKFIVNVLLKAGANPYIQDLFGNDAYDYGLRLYKEK